ncbi:MAG: DUF4469 domain-containing protein, partial [Dysgonamonadaceae bacterium]|nr:DUF4469 domain-containing protein [Dysgonamonadaceae bacterium]
MAIDFKLKDVMHRITTKFYPAYLPNAKKKYVMRTVYEPELDIHDIASKAEVYNITTAPKVIEEGMIAGMELITYLAADGFKIKTPVFTLKIAIPGEYDGSETHLPAGVTPQGRLNLSAELRKYLGEHIAIQIDGIEETNGIIAEVINHVTGEIDLTINAGGIFFVRGTGLKIDSDDLHADETGLFLEFVDSGDRIKIDPVNIALNGQREIRAI